MKCFLQNADIALAVWNYGGLVVAVLKFINVEKFSILLYWVKTVRNMLSGYHFQGLFLWNQTLDNTGYEWCFRSHFCTARLGTTWVDKFCYESCSWCSNDRSTCWPAVQRAATVLGMPFKEYESINNKINKQIENKNNGITVFMDIIWKHFYIFHATNNVMIMCSVGMKDEPNLIYLPEMQDRKHPPSAHIVFAWGGNWAKLVSPCLT